MAGQPEQARARPHAPLTVAGNSYTYDANGNLIGAEGRSYGYDVENHLSTVTEGSTTLRSLGYDGDGALRSETQSSVLTWHYLTGDYRMNRVTTTPFVFYQFGGQAVAMRRGADSLVYYVHRDQVGSVVSVSDTTGTQVSWFKFWAFGSLKASGTTLSGGTFPTDRLFTGQIRDLGDDRFNFFKSRFHNAAIGKFRLRESGSRFRQNQR